MVRTSYEGSEELSGSNIQKVTSIEINGQEHIDVPSNGFTSDAAITRDGQDLVLEAPNGQTLILEGYFSAESQPVIQSPEGGSLTPKLVESFATSPSEFASNGSMNDQSPVGAVEELTGNATIQRADGSIEKLNIGSPIYQGDIVETDAEGAVNILFVDETSFAVSDNARLAIDEYVFDPETESGSTNFSVLRGVFVFTSGLIGRDDPDDVEIDTPVGSIGIRGTIIAGDINPNGESEITVIEGAIVVKNDVSETTLAEQFKTVKLAGINSQMQDMGVLDARDVSNKFSPVGDVMPSLFSALNDAVKEQGNAGPEAAPEQGPDNTPDNAPEGEAKEGAEAGAQEEAPESAAEQGPEQKADDAGEQPQEIDVAPEEAAPEGQPDQAPELDAKDALQDAIREQIKQNRQGQFQDEFGEELKQDIRESIREQIQEQIQEQQEADHAANETNVAEEGADEPIINPDDLPPPPEETTGEGGNQNTNFFALNGQNTGQDVHRVTGFTAGTGRGFSIGSSGDGGNFYVTSQQGHVFTIDAASLSVTGPVINPVAGSNDRIVEGIGDFDGNSQNDFIIGSPNRLSGQGIGEIHQEGVGLINSNFSPGESGGSSVSGLGDINNDGFDDVIIGAQNAGTNNQGGVRVVLGNNSSDPAGTGDVTGSASSDYGFAHNVEGIGDINGDGFDDFALSIIDSDITDANIGDDGEIKIFFGGTNADPFANDTPVILTGFNTNDGSNTDLPITHLGDVDGDGFDDFLSASIGDGKAFITLGDPSLSSGSVYGTGVQIDSTTGLDGHIIGGGAAGDFNADGLDDTVLVVKEANNRNKVYVVYGHEDLNTLSMIDQAYLDDPAHAFEMVYFGNANEFTIESLGDYNGDGFDDIAIGVAQNNDVFVVDGRKAGDVLYNDPGDFSASTGGGQPVEDSIIGTNGGNTFFNLGQENIHFEGRGGNDTFNMTIGELENGISIDGGNGNDTLALKGLGSVDFGQVESINGVEKIEFDTTGGDQTVTLTLDDLFQLMKQSDDGTITFDKVGANNARLDFDLGYTGSRLTGDAALTGALGTDATPLTVTSDGGAGGDFNYEIGGYTLIIDGSVDFGVI